MSDREERCEAFSALEEKRLSDSSVCVIGCGGLGGYVIEMLTRAGIGRLTAVDGDVFDESNLSRQLLADLSTFGKNKAQEAVRRAARINPAVQVKAVPAFFSEKNGRNILEGCDAAVDALDNQESRILLEKLCAEKMIPMIHGGVSGWCGEAGVIHPGYHIPVSEEDPGGAHVPVPSFVPAFAASLEVSACLKYILGKEDILENQILFFDLLAGEFHILSLRGER